MTDIWRSFVVQRILWENEWRLSFHSLTAYQERNAPSLMRDFEDEISGSFYYTDLLTNGVHDEDDRRQS